MSVGAGPANLAWHVYFKHYKNPKELSRALAPIFNAEMKDLVAAGAKYLQFEDLGAWLPLFTNDVNDYKWIREVVEQCCDGVDAKIGWHFCFGNAWGNDILSANFPEGYQTVLPYFFETKGIDEFVLDYANRDMAGIEFLKNLPKDKGVQVGVLDIRTNAIETPADDRRPNQEGPRRRAAREGDAELGLRHEAAGADGGEDEAEGARRRREDRAGRVDGREVAATRDGLKRVPARAADDCRGRSSDRPEINRGTTLWLTRRSWRLWDPLVRRAAVCVKRF